MPSLVTKRGLRVITSTASLLALAVGAAAFSSPARAAAQDPASPPVYEAHGDIKPSLNSKWCLSADSHAESGDKLFIAECGQHGTYQQWVAERIELGGENLGFIELLGTQLAVGSDGSLAVLLPLNDASNPSTGLVFTPRGKGKVWEVQNDFYHSRPMSTAKNVSPDKHYTVFWHTSNDYEWVFGPWKKVGE
jgi:hypothetical protein